MRKINSQIIRYKFEGCVKLNINDRTLALEIDKEQFKEAAKLDGCYVLKTDLTKKQANKVTVHDRYKDLSQVESAFRACKSGHLEMRPIFVRLEESTRAHVLIVMLAYRLIQELANPWSGLNLTVEEGLQELATLCFNKTTIAGQGECNVLPAPRETVADLIKRAGVKLPEVAPSKNVKADTRNNCRKSEKLSNSQ